MADGSTVRRTEILLAEDDPDVRKWVAIALSSEGYEVRTAADGVEALKAVRAKRPHVLVLDVMMPRKDGIETLRELREQKNGPNS